MKIKALTGIETTRFVPDEDEHGIITTRSETVQLKGGEIADLDEKLARRLIGYGHASEDLSAETHTERLNREAAEPAEEVEPQAPAEEAAPAAPAEPAAPDDAPTAAN